MAKQSSVNLDITNNADGFSIAGGSTSRTLGVSGADITLVGSGTATLTFPTTSTTIAGLGITQTFTALQTFNAGMSASSIYSSGGITGGTYMSSEGGYRITSNAIRTLTGTTYTLLVGDDGKIITSSNAANQIFTIPTGLPVGFNCSVIQLGAAPVGFVGASGVTLNSFAGKTFTAGQYAAVSIIEYATNLISISGGLTT